MASDRLARLCAVALVALALFNFPMVEVVERWAKVTSVPLVPLYFFVAWAG